MRLSIASVSIPFGQRFITIELAEHHHLAFEFPNLYLETIIEVLPTAGADLTGADTSQRIVNYQPIFQVGHPDGPNVDRMELYVNNIFVNPEVHDIFIKRIGFSLIRVYREQITRITQDGAGEMLLSQLKWPVEYMFVGMRPAWNIRHVCAGAGGIVSGGNPNVWRDWHRMTKMVDADVDVRQRAQIALASCVNAAGSFVGDVLAHADPGATSNLGQVVHDTYAIPVPTVDSLTLTAHGITIFDDFRDIFFNSYMPFHFGGPALNTPDDPGALFVNFALFPRSYQPSGHLNISRARETYIKWTTSYISPKTPADLLVVAIAINFLLITDSFSTGPVRNRETRARKGSQKLSKLRQEGRNDVLRWNSLAGMDICYTKLAAPAA